MEHQFTPLVSVYPKDFGTSPLDFRSEPFLSPFLAFCLFEALPPKLLASLFRKQTAQVGFRSDRDHLRQVRCLLKDESLGLVFG